MSYELKGLDVLRDGAKVAIVNPENGELDFLEGCDNYRIPAVKMLRELDIWDDENTCIRVEKLEIKPPETGASPGIPLTAEEIAQKIIEEAQAKAENIIREATAKAEEIIKGAQEKAKQSSGVVGKTADQKAETGISCVKELIAAMQPHIKEKCPPMHPRSGDKTPEVIAWIQKHDDIRRKILNNK